MMFRRSPGLTKRHWLINDATLERLDDVFGLLVGGSRTAPSRQQTMRAPLVRGGGWNFALPAFMLAQATHRRSPNS
jgi:hypothetical protein